MQRRSWRTSSGASLTSPGHGSCWTGSRSGCPAALTEPDRHAYAANELVNRLYRNAGDGTFADVAQEAGLGRQSRWSRGAAFADFDNDGDMDVAVLNADDTPSLLRNDGGNQ